MFDRCSNVCLSSKANTQRQQYMHRAESGIKQWWFRLPGGNEGQKMRLWVKCDHHVSQSNHSSSSTRTRWWPSSVGKPLLIEWSRTTPTIQSIDISFETANFKKHIRSYKKKSTFETDTLEATENNVVNIANLLWLRRFNPKRQKKNTWNTPCLKKHVLANNISNTANTKKNCWWKDSMDKLVELLLWVTSKHKALQSACEDWPGVVSVKFANIFIINITCLNISFGQAKRK